MQTNIYRFLKEDDEKHKKESAGEIAAFILGMSLLILII